MSIEASVALTDVNTAIYWSLPPGRSAGYLPDAPPLWDLIFEMRKTLWGIAHSHPGRGVPGPSFEDATTYEGIERFLGRRLTWPIISADRTALVKWVGPNKLDYKVVAVLHNEPAWVEELRKHSNYNPVRAIVVTDQNQR